MIFKSILTRLNIAVMIFTAAFMNYSLRNNISVNIIAMVPGNTSNGSSTNSECDVVTANFTSYNESSETDRYKMLRQPADIVIFDWSEQQQAYVLSAYFYGYAVTTLFGGTVAESCGPRRLVFVSMLINALLTLLSPWSAKISYKALVAVRILSGVVGGFIFPSFHVLMAHWVPPDEMGKFVSMLQGSLVGTMVTWALSGPLIEAYGWDYAFYIPGIVAIIWCAIWWYMVYDSPIQHPRISSEELQYISNAIGDRVQQSKDGFKVIPPFRHILTSFPFLAMIILHFGNNWGIYFLITMGPKYVSSALGFNLTSTGTIASLPNLVKVVFSMIFGALGDRIIGSNVVSLTFTRKFFCITSHIIPGLLLIGLGYTGCSPYLSISLITLSMAFNGSASMTSMLNHQDLAPNFAGTLYGIANCVGNTTGFIIPLVTAHFLKNGNGVNEWRPVFITGASIYIGSAIYFILFASTKIQSWNYISSKNNVKQNKEETIDIPVNK